MSVILEALEQDLKDSSHRCSVSGVLADEELKALGEIPSSKNH